MIILSILFFLLLPMVSLSAPPSLDSLVQIYPQADSSIRAEIFQTLSQAAAERPEQTLLVGQQIKGLAEQHNHVGAQTLIYRILGDAYEVLGNYDSAKLYVKKSIALARETDNPKQLAKGYNLLGIIHDVQGSYDRALKSFFHALSIWEDEHDQEGINTAYINIGNIYAYQEENQKALTYYQKSLDIANTIQDTLGIIMALNNIGSSWQELDSLNLAFDYYQRSITIAREQGNEQDIALPLDGISHILIKRGKYDEALNNATYLLNLAQKYQNINDKIYAYRLLADVHKAKKSYQTAIARARQGYNLARQSGAKLEITYLSELLASLYRVQGNFKKALQYQSIYMAYQDTLYSLEKRKIINNLELTRTESENEMLKKENELRLAQIEKNEAIIDRQTAYAIGISLVSALLLGIIIILYRLNLQRKKSNFLLSHQKEEIALNNAQLTKLNQTLKQQQGQLQTQNEELERLNDSKNKLLSIISHDFRSPLSSLQGVINILNTQTMSPEEIKQIFDALSTKVQNTTNMLDNLLKWTRSQMQGIRIQPEQFAVSTVVEEVINSLAILAEKKGVLIHQNISQSLLVYADPEMVRMVIRNLVSNAIKFTVKGDTITIKAQLDNDSKVVISVIDTGLGISDENMAILFQLKDHTTYGTANEKGTGLGLILCKDFVEKNGGEIWVESEVKKGSVFFFTLLTEPTHFPATTSQNILSATS
uniref:histidine kinase n=1 Tax=Roseihalotalea indica TaxID=2867963 RepID=A0AA49GSG6_9BACT|nr:tetratricopeptide repeat-containing sensor histidine kinase [Tunicatimonas sp. TK19036]